MSRFKVGDRVDVDDSDSARDYGVAGWLGAVVRRAEPDCEGDIRIRISHSEGDREMEQWWVPESACRHAGEASDEPESEVSDLVTVARALGEAWRDRPSGGWLGHDGGGAPSEDTQEWVLSTRGRLDHLARLVGPGVPDVPGAVALLRDGPVALRVADHDGLPWALSYDGWASTAHVREHLDRVLHDPQEAEQ